MIPKQVLEDLRNSSKIVAVTHIHPDGDALGSLLGFAAIMDSLGKEVFCLLEEPVSHLYTFLPGQFRLSWDVAQCRAFLEGVGDDFTVVSLDCGDVYRIAETVYKQISGAKTFVVLDHHASHKNFGTSRWVNVRSSSTGEMVYELAEALGAKVTPEAAYNLYVAIMTDTGSFRYECTKPRTMQIAGKLLDCGVNAAEVSSQVYDTYTPERLRLLQKFLDSMELLADNRIALMTVTQKMLAETGTGLEDVENFINLPRAIHSVKVAVLLKEGENGNVSASMRAKGEVDVSKIAAGFGGGGHRNAAGFRLQNMTIAELRKEILEILIKAV